MARAIHHQESDKPAALVDHRETDLAAELVCLRDPRREHLEARLLGEPMARHEIRHGARPSVTRFRAQRSGDAAHGPGMKRKRIHATSLRVLGTNNSSAVTAL